MDKSLPEGWHYKSLAEIANIYNGNSINTRVKKEKYMSGGVGWNYIATKDIGFDCLVNYANGVKIPKSETNFRIAPKGSVLVCSEGGSAGKKSAYITQDVCFGNKLYAITNHKGLFDEKYVFYFTRYNLFFESFKTKMNGIIGGVSTKKFGQIIIPLPSIMIQKAIVAKIEELFSELDKGVGALQKIKEQLKVYRQAVLKDAYSLENEKKCMLKECCNFITKGTTPKKNEMIDYKREIPFIKVYNLTFTGQLDFSIDPTFISAETHKGFLGRSITIPNDVLMNIVGPPMGKVSIVPNTYPEWNINQAIVRFRCLETLNYKYLAYFLMFSKTIEKMKRKAKATAGQFNLTLEICRDLEIPLPCIERQVEIITEIESRLSICERIEQIVDEALLKAESLRQSILKKAFEGKLVTQEETING